MHESYEIASSTGGYAVELGEGLLAEVIARNADAIYIVDSLLVDRLPAQAARRLIVEATEDAKSLESAPEFVAQLRKLGATRDTHLVAIGGGVVQDAATFLASIYMRGLPWTYMPTTMLAMADSCIGGKSSINVAGYKNLVGNFYPPRDVAIDLDFVTTLDREMIVGGLFEAGKICFAQGPDRFDDYLALQPERATAPGELGPIVSLSLRTKKWFIETDEFDQKERLLLNFGHTFGHAIESSTNFGVSHGIAVGVGMLAACEFALAGGAPEPAPTARLRKHVRDMFGRGNTAVIAHPPAVDIALTMEKFDYDKKHKAGFYRMVTPDAEGRLELKLHPRNDATRAAVSGAYQRALQDIGWL